MLLKFAEEGGPRASAELALVPGVLSIRTWGPLTSGEAIMYNQSRGVCRTCRPAGAADHFRARVSSRLGGPPVLPCFPGGFPMAIPHAKPGEVIDVRPLGSALAQAKTTTLVKTPTLEVIRLIIPEGK